MEGYVTLSLTLKAGMGATKFQTYTVRKRIYGMDWEGTSRVRATLDRKYRVTREKNE
jgi:hypothetical protein